MALKRLFYAAGAPIEFQILGRVLLHAALVGAAAGLLGSLFFAGVEATQRVALEGWAGYAPLRAGGEQILGELERHGSFHPMLLALIPAVGALLGGAISIWLAPETRGGGSDAIIDAFHNAQGRVRKRVAFVKAVVSILTLGSGGSGGREGPTMQMGGALGSLVGQVLRVSDRERRILLVAGTAAGMAAVFRTPLGAALLAVEVLHRDDFESDAIVPSVLASVVAYSVFIAFFGERTLFTHAPSYPFVPAHLPLYALLAVGVSIVASAFLSMLRGVQAATVRLPVPEWCKPGLGGLALGAFATPIIVLIGPHLGQPGQGMGILGGGYGAAQLAITGAPWFPLGWRGVELLALLGAVKMVATYATPRVRATSATRSQVCGSSIQCRSKRRRSSPLRISIVASSQKIVGVSGNDRRKAASASRSGQPRWIDAFQNPIQTSRAMHNPPTDATLSTPAAACLPSAVEPSHPIRRASRATPSAIAAKPCAANVA